jgi:hypothetical protein
MAMPVGRTHTIECPATIRVQQSLVPAAPEPWVAYDTKEGPDYIFYGVSFSDGPPKKRVFLVPSKTIRSGNVTEEIYDFKAANVSNVWLLCLYRDTSTAISRRIDGVGRCRVTYDPKTGFRSVKAVDCD